MHITDYCSSFFSGKKKSISIDKWNVFLHSSDIELCDREGNLYGLQVKSGSTPINASEYEGISELMKIYLFAANDEVYNLNDLRNIEKIEISEVTSFIEGWKHILPKRIKYWFE